MTSTKKLLAVMAISAVAASVATAQTDVPTTGSGSAVTSSVAPLGLPGGGAGGGASLSGSGMSGLSAARAAFMNASGAGAVVENPAGGSATVPTDAARGLGAILGGNATDAQVAAFTAALTGVPAARATALVNALTALGGGATMGNLQNAVRAYNAAVQSLPAGAAVPPALLGARSALAGASRS